MFVETFETGWEVMLAGGAPGMHPITRAAPRNDWICQAGDAIELNDWMPKVNNGYFLVGNKDVST